MASNPSPKPRNPPSKPRQSGAPADQHNVKLSKQLSYILRHGAAKEKIAMRSDGFVKVDDLLSHRLFKGYTLKDIEAVVRDNEKKRFTMIVEGDDGPTAGEAGESNGSASTSSEGKPVYLIRANQGHSLEVEDLDLVEIKDAAEIPVVIHGTYKKHWASISEKGLSKMSRNHIHCASGMLGSDGVISGMRKSCDLYIYISSTKGMAAGLVFFKSANGVILTPGNADGVIPKELFEKVVTSDGQDLLGT